MNELIPINIIIADRSYRIKTKPSDEEVIRKTVKLINDKVFGTPQTIMLSMSISLFLSACLSAIILYRGLKPFAVTVKKLEASR